MAEVLEVGERRWAHQGNNKSWLQRIGQKQRKRPHSKQAVPAPQFGLDASPHILNFNAGDAFLNQFDGVRPRLRFLGSETCTEFGRERLFRN
jgi:hypothetical protein